MKSLAGSSLNLFLVEYKKLYYRNNICCTRPRHVCLSRPQKSHFLGCPQQQLQASFSQRSFNHAKFSVCVLSSSGVQTGLQQEDNPGDETTPEAKESESVRVKFELRRECLFGQHFFLVGDDPTFGSWDPSEAIPLNWSDGHIWYVELDICVGKSIKYKFILNQGDGTILWQPGEDRVLETFQTGKTIKVTDNWDNIEPEVAEEEWSPGLFEQIVADSDMQLVADNLTVISEYTKDDTTDKDPRDDEETSTIPVEMLSSENLKKTVAMKNHEETGEVEVVTEIIEPYANKNKLVHSYSSEEVDENILSNAKNNENVDYNEDFPVLVPGLIPLPKAASEEPEADRIEEKAFVSDLYHESDIIEEVNVTELCGSSQAIQILEEELAMGSTNSPGASTVMINSNAVQPLENTQSAKDKQVSEPPLQNDILECDFQWGKKSLQKILMALGLF
ncbi:amylase [Lithospermum erythrorhizon]|uniref:Amylase n=1 Tax=Lithospermum erythrorhizon TaxID=34254 RepID=A0AAV3PSX3_LITER